DDPTISDEFYPTANLVAFYLIAFQVLIILVKN
ncbi:unnamed protein product, partial [marine sediment metagenome]